MMYLLTPILCLLWMTVATATPAIVHQNITTGVTATTQDFTSPDFGTPEAALIILSGDTDSGDGTAAGIARLSVGFTDCTGQHAITLFAHDNTSPTNTARGQNDDRVAFTQDPSGAGVADGGHASGACITDGVRLTVVTQFSAEYEVTVVLFGTDDLANAAVGCTITDATLGNSVDVTAPGFLPDIVIGMTIGVSNCVDGVLSGNFFALGFAENGGGQGGCGMDSTHNVGTTGLAAVCSQQWAVNSHNEFTNDFSYEVTSFDASGFSLTTRNDSGESNGVMWLALQMASGVGSDVLFMDSPTSTGTQAYTGEAYTPGFALVIGTEVTTYDTDFTDERAGGLFISVATSSAQYSHSVNDQDLVSTTNTQSRVEPQAMWLDDHDGDCTPECLRATHVSMDNNGFTWNFTETLGSAAKWAGMTMESTTAAPPGEADHRRVPAIFVD